MEFLHIAILSLIQGLTEFLPISSSAHLILPSEILGWPDQGLAFDVAVHFGSLLAVIVYYRQKLRQLTIAWFGSFGSDARSEPAQQAWLVLYATLPALLVGLIINQFEDVVRDGLIIAVSTIVFGLLLAWADSRAGSQPLNTMTIKQGLVIGVAQCLALIPGTSRSGITMTAALAMGFRREAAAEFSFLLSVPLIAAAAVLKTVELIFTDGAVHWQTLLTGFVLSAISAYGCIRLFLHVINRIGFLPFVIYRLMLGGVLLYLLW